MLMIILMKGNKSNKKETSHSKVLTLRYDWPFFTIYFFVKLTIQLTSLNYIYIKETESMV